MSIVVEGVGELIVVDIFPLQLPEEEQGVCTVAFHLPADADFDLHADEGEDVYPQIVTVKADSEDACVGIDVDVSEPNAYPQTVYARWGPDEQVVRGPASSPVHMVLDGLAKRAWAGVAIDRPGGPEYAARADPTLGAEA